MCLNGTPRVWDVGQAQALQQNLKSGLRVGQLASVLLCKGASSAWQNRDTTSCC